jgi:hypothetical protein
MGTYYKYAERNADSQINWAEVGKDMSDMLKDEVKVREEKKAAIDAASREFGRVLSDPPQGEHTGASTFALRYADNASQFLKMQDQLLKSGQMKVQNYTISRQNLTDGTDTAFNLVKNYQKFYGEKMERYRTDKSQDFEQWAMGQSEIFSNFNKYDLYINPTDGSLSLAAKELKNIDGKDVYVMNPKPSTFATVNTINNWITGQYDKFDTNAAADAFNAALGEELKATTTQIATLSKTGQITTIADITSRTDIDPDTKKILFKFIDAENQGIESVYANDINRMSAVTNSVKFCSTNKKQYTFTTDETDAKNNPEKIYMKVDPNSGKSTPVFSDVQIKDSDNFMRNEFRRRYDYKENIQTTGQIQRQDPRPKTAAEIEFEQKKDDAKIFGQKMADVVSGQTAEETQLALDYFNTLPGVNANKEGNKVSIAYTDDQGNTDTQDFELLPSGGFKNAHNVGVTMAKLVNKQGLPEEAVAKAMDDVLKGRQGGTSFSATNKKSAVVDEDYTSKLGAYANEKLETAIEEDDPKTTVKNLTKDFGKLGYKFSGESRGIVGQDDYIQIQAPNGTLSEWIPVDNKENTNKISDFIKKNKNDEILNKSGLFPTKKQQAAAAAKAADCVNGKDKFGNPC